MDDFQGVDMPKTTCSIDGCDRPNKARTWCQAHYMYWYEKRVTPPPGPVRKWGRKRVESCSVDGCNNPYDALGYCEAHYKRVKSYGEPGPAEITPRVVPDDQTTYGLIHNRLRDYRGSASRHHCVQCDTQAMHWAYDHCDPNQRLDERGYAFSVDLSHYRPMCASCHRRFDANREDAAQMHVLADN